MSLDPVAAEEIADRGIPCSLDDCDGDANWLVQFRHGTATKAAAMCQPCSREHKVLALENELFRNDVDVAVLPWEPDGRVHIVCQDCPFEALVPADKRSEPFVIVHEDATGHDVHTDSVDGSVELATDGGRPTLTLTGDGLEIPDGVDLSEGVVFRARGVTVDHKPGSADREFYPALDDGHLTAEDRGVINEDLDENEVAIKPYGEEVETYRVAVPATDGGPTHTQTPLYERDKASLEEPTMLVLLLAGEDGATYATIREQLEEVEMDVFDFDIENIDEPIPLGLSPEAQPARREPHVSLEFLVTVDYVEYYLLPVDQEDEIELTSNGKAAVSALRAGLSPDERDALQEVGVDADRLVTDGGREQAFPGDDLWPDYRDADICVGDVVVDLSRTASLQVMGVSTQRAGEHPKVRSDRTAEMFGVDEDELVYNCVFLPDGDDAVSPPKKTYAYPASRLLRYPVEEATSNERLQREWLTNVLEELAVEAEHLGEAQRRYLLEVVAEAFGSEVADLAEEFADAAGGDA